MFDMTFLISETVMTLSKVSVDLSLKSSVSDDSHGVVVVLFGST